MSASIKRQLLAPFAAGLAALAVAIGIGSVLASRGAANEELESRAARAEQMVRQTIDRTRDRLEDDARLLEQLLGVEPVSGSALERRLVTFSAERDLSHASVVDSRGRLVAGDGRAHWTDLDLAKRLRRSAVEGSNVSATGVSDRGEPLILAASRSDLGAGATVTLGRSIDRTLLSPVERSIGVLLQVQTSARGGGEGSLEDGGTRTFVRPLRLSGTEVELLISTSDLRVSAATWSILMVTGGAGVLVLIILLAFLQMLLGRSIVSPVRRLSSGIRRVQGGDHAARVALEGAEELRFLAEGFNEMTATVGAQHRRLELLAATDHLTGLANHRAFHEALHRALAQAEREHRPLGLVIVDLDHFKPLNDTHGHAYGDEVLRLVAGCLQEAVRDSDLVGRVGGEEFALLLPGAEPAMAMAVAERARGSVHEIDLPGPAINCSAGVAVFPDDTVDGAELLHLADVALYAAKGAGRGQTHRFDAREATMLTPEQQREEVRSLLRHRELVNPVFQPVVSLGDARVVGYEALTRFDHPSGRSPTEWFALARRCGLGEALQALAVERALEVAERPPDTFLSINLDPSALGAPAVEHSLPRDLTGIVVEITEQELISDHARLNLELSGLRARGARIALDDTGAGYAGLQHMIVMRPEVIKVDRALVEGIDSDSGKLALLESFTSFARRTGAQVCAEGVETTSELTVLADLGVDLGQGYLLGRPGTPWPTLELDAVECLRIRNRNRASTAAEPAPTRTADAGAR